MWWHYPEPVEPEELKQWHQRRAERARQGLLRNLIGWLIAWAILGAGFLLVVWLVRLLS